MSSLNNLRFGFNDIIDYLRTSFCIFARIKTKDYIMAEKHTLQPKQPRIETFIEVAVHVLAWSYIFISPLFFKRRGETIDWNHYIYGSLLPITLCVSFYLNYFIFVPRFLLNKEKRKWFFICNVLIFCVYQFGIELQAFLLAPMNKPMASPRGGGIGPRPEFRKDLPPKVFFIVRGFLFYVSAIGASVVLHLSKRWKQSEKARAEAELGRSQAELKNLKNQINPHFLLNTLNNIYALTGFDQEKAQWAIHELSRLLRYMLYENQTERVSLNKEVEFLQSYISLMRLRLLDNVDVKVVFDYPKEENLQIAPLIFISLVENAFKHGISSGQHNFIHVTLKSDAHHLCFCCENSNTPQRESDKSPGGIGLQQVASRLEYSYPNRYTWRVELADGGSTYRSVIDIYDKPIKH